jgi:hypothetical protein
MIRRALAAVCLAAAAALLGAVPATAATIWNLDIHHNPTNFSHSNGQYWIELANTGDTNSSGPITLTLDLPPGVFARTGVETHAGFGGGVSNVSWDCPGFVGETTITCTTSEVVPRRSVTRGLAIDVGVYPAAVGDPVVTGTVSGGGAAAPATASDVTHVSDTPASFGIAPGTWVGDFFEADGLTPVRQAGAHPYEASFSFDMNSVDAPRGEQPLQKAPVGNLRDISVKLPPGFVGNPTAVAECRAEQFLSVECPPASQVGRADLTVYPATSAAFDLYSLPVYNLTHPRGVLNDLGFDVQGNPVHIEASLDPARNYAINTTVSDLNESLPPFTSKVTIWGYPKDPAHDSERCAGPTSAQIGTAGSCASDGPEKPFVTTPFDCSAAAKMTLSEYDTWQESGAFGPDVDYTLPGNFTGCGQVPFEPTVSVTPTNDVADSPSGLDVHIHLPQDEDPTHIATSPLKDAKIVLPEGITVNPSSANGLEACTPAQISLGTDDPVACPGASKVASAEITTPVLPEPIEGSLYLATQDENPFHSLLAGYIVFSDPDRGILIKIPGKIEADPATGRLTGTFEENPELPFSDLQLHFKAGAHSTLITPKTCGTYAATSELAGWAGNPPSQGSSSFNISGAPGGGSCAVTEAALPNSPSFDAGTVSPLSRSYTPFVLHLRREDGTQRFSAFDVTLPPGLTGKLAGTALCPDASLAAAESASGRQEQADPSCPGDSHVGEVVAAVGAGPSPYYAKGDAYLAGPYKGAPVSLAVITPAVAGPFDLGTIVIRTPLHIDPSTAQISATSDPIPQMLDGIPTDVRSIEVVLDRPEFTLTGTSCNASQVSGELTSTAGLSTSLSSRFQLSDCGRLPFAPKLSLRLKGKTTRAQYPALTATLTAKPGEANIASAQVGLPHSEFIAQAHIGNVCTRPQLAAEKCPPSSVIGHASALTPLVSYPLEGNVYLGTGYGYKLPAVVAVLKGPAYQPIQITLVGKVDTDARKGIRNTFEVAPDAPVSKFVLSLKGGSRGLLVNSENLCGKPQRAAVNLSAQNGKTSHLDPLIANGCKKTKKGAKGKKRKGHKHRRTQR